MAKAAEGIQARCLPCLQGARRREQAHPRESFLTCQRIRRARQALVVENLFAPVGNVFLPQDPLRQWKFFSLHSRDRMNSTPTRCTSPAGCSRTTRAVIAGVVSGTNPAEGGEGAGIRRETICCNFSGRGLAKHAPTALIFVVLMRSRNSSPYVSSPRRNTGICRRIRGHLRRSSSPGLFAKVDPGAKVSAVLLVLLPAIGGRVRRRHDSPWESITV
jgi:hypothetical protein